ncbi:MAG TPA: M48 family metallopeptidase [Xanthomonadaceae bacterium]|nr:M48 family metallopeptidase [Xanthomonadaceae bacterium]
MNFFEHQRQARTSSRRLVVLFVLAVAGIVLAVDAALLAAIAIESPTPAAQYGSLPAFAAAHMPALVAASLVTLSVIGISSLVKIAGLRRGGGAVALELGGTRVPEDTHDFPLRRLRNVVEEIAIASGVPVPEIYVLEQEAGINAFAAGWSPSDAAIAVTRGALEHLNRDELQGVIAHEFSHVINGDMRLNIRLMGLLFGILVLAIVGRKVLYHSRGGGRSKGGGAILLVALAVMVVGYAGVLFGRLIKAGVSRRRELLADASAVQFTRQASGLAGALKKIGGVPAGSRLHSADVEDVSHMLFGDGQGLAAWWATHPPLLERIRRLEPGFDGKALQALQAQWRDTPPRGLDEDAALGLVGRESAASTALPGPGRRIAVDARTARHVGEPELEDYRHAAELVSALPEELRRRARDRQDCAPLLLALVLDSEPELRARQLALVAERHDARMASAVEAVTGAVRGLHPGLRLPLAELAFPALRRRPRAELEQLSGTVDALVHADGRVHRFEYCLARLVTVHLRDALDPARAAAIGRVHLHRAHTEVAGVLAVLAQAGHEDAEGARRAFQAGLLEVLPRESTAYRPPSDWAGTLDAALPRLDRLDPAGKKMLVDAMVTATAHDGRVAVAEAELLRTICACLHCPLPPLLGAGGGE